ncbi:Shedu anti-phage system protein SduA domain-containing protein [Rhizobium sp. No.120]
MLASTPDELEALRVEYLELLDKNEKEQVYQKYMEANTRLIPREFIQNHGVSCRVVLRKLALGSDYKSDFFFLSKSTTHWNAVHIEIEKPSSKYFKGNTNEFAPGFQRALHQITDWKAWFIRENEQSFRSSLSALLVPSHMAKNPIKHKYVIVYGRRDEYEGNDLRRTKIMAQQSDDLKIMSFDSLAEGLAGKPVLDIGIRRNEYIDLMADKINDPAVLAYIEPTQFRISQTLHANIVSRINGGGMFIQRNEGGKLWNGYEYVADNIRVRSDKSEIESEV